MRAPGRSLSAEEAELWARVARTVDPFERPRPTSPAIAASVRAPTGAPPPPGKQPRRMPKSPAAPAAAPPPAAARAIEGHTLDARWDRLLARGLASPDFTLDLHGATLDGAYSRLDHGLTQAMAQGARLVLLITGRPRPRVDPADRSSRRGAIRAKFGDWLAHGRHAARIAAIRPAHPRHGGAGAVYIVLRKGK